MPPADARVGLTVMLEQSYLGTHIRAGRVAKNLTQKTLGELIGTNQSSVAAWESGKVQPKIPVLVTIADVLELDLHDLIDAAAGKPNGLGTMHDPQTT